METIKWKDGKEYYFSEMWDWGEDLQEVIDITSGSINNNLHLFFEKDEEQIKKSLEDKIKSWWKIFTLKNEEGKVIGTCSYLKQERYKYNDFWWLHIERDYLRKWLWNKLMTEVVKEALKDWITELGFHTTRKKSPIKKEDVEKKKEEGEENESPAIKMYNEMPGVEFVEIFTNEYWTIKLESARYIIDVKEYTNAIIDIQNSKAS